jgi:hypothetical protein
MRVSRSSAVLIGLLAMAPQALAQSDPKNCYTGPLELGEDLPLRLMRVQSEAPRVNFIESLTDKKPQCPSTAEACKRRGFLTPGDDVIAGPDHGGFTCVTYISPDSKRVKGKFAETSGFIRTVDLAEVPLRAPTFQAWQGVWNRSEEADITITGKEGGKLVVAGEATFGAQDPDRVRRGAVNSGQLEGEGTPRGHILALGENYDGLKAPKIDMGADCTARLRLFGRYLVVEDNLGCGGMNVNFLGFYIKFKSAP